MNPIATYFNACVDMLTATAAAAAATTHPGDLGTTREAALLGFLRHHLPRRLEADLGGVVLDAAGTESKQIDILVTNDIGLRFSSNEKEAHGGRKYSPRL